MTKIVAEICDNRKIHGKIMASTVQSKHVLETLFLYYLPLGQKNKQYKCDVMVTEPSHAC